MKVCIYLRKSRADRERPEVPPEDVLKNHEAILLAFAEKSNLEIADIKKEVVSGESLARRPEMLRLLEEVEDGLYDAVLVKDFDRLGRGSMMEQGIIIEAFRKSATKIITPEKTYDLENEFDEEYTKDGIPEGCVNVTIYSDGSRIYDRGFTLSEAFRDKINFRMSRCWDSLDDRESGK